MKNTKKKNWVAEKMVSQKPILKWDLQLFSFFSHIKLAITGDKKKIYKKF